VRLAIPAVFRQRLSFLPKENTFFYLLHQSALNIQQVARRVQDLMDNYENVEAKVQEIKDLEDFGDRIIHDITRSLHRTFVTPIDREDILALAGSLDDVVDAMDEAAQYTLEYRIEEPTEAARKLAAIIVECADELEQAVGMLSTRGSKLKDILPKVIEINRLENEADRVHSHARSELFSDGHDVATILKWRDIYDDLEQATDRAEDAADILEGIVLKHS
jgi:predicted phosphate transport protein (TIGR00153 family)